ncbi:MAG: DNA polymerase III subunit gamma/tau [Clostridiales bacterium]|nr:DNA polymerase III subunit gamma/tau [Clostridiales bacterium]
MYQALYRTFRPETFEGILGQEHIVRILKNQISENTFGHAYLFCGTRGTGKTTVARILAKGVNCTADIADRPCGTCSNCIAIRDGVFIDVIEIDAASNTGVDNIRELRESVNYPPAVGRCKVYIIDEVHMLSTGAFNALLKTLEEPPKNIMFILATTEPQKLPATILSRCLRLDFRRISEKQMREGFREICSKLGFKISDSALGLIVANADGSVRDGLSILDQCISFGKDEIVKQDVLDILGTAGEEVFIEITDLVERNLIAEALLLLNRVLDDGKDVRQFMKDWIAHYRSLMITKFVKNPEDVLNVSLENVERIREQSNKIDLANINKCIMELSRTLNEAKWSTQPRILLEVCIVKLAFDGKPEIIEHKVETEKTIKTKKQKAPVQVKMDQKIDKEKIWRKVFEDGESDKGSMNFLRKGSRLKDIDEYSFYVEVANDIFMRYANDNCQLLESLMEKYTGRKLKMECILSPKLNEETQQKTIEDIAGELENRLGIDVEIE